VPLITKVKITNYRCLKDLLVPLKPLTVLVGKNDTGKSAFLAALETAAGLAGLSDPDDFWRRDRNCAPTIYLKSELGSFSVGFGKQEGQREQVFSRVTTFRLPSQGVAMQSGGLPHEAGVPSLQSDGSNVAAFVDFIFRRELKSRFVQFVNAVRDAIPGVEDINVPTPDPASRRIDVVIEDGLTLPGPRMSTGARLMIFFLALAYHPAPPELILIEEPENGVHPKRLADIVALLRGLTTGKHAGYQAQVILTTHSPYLLDCIDLATDQVLAFKRNDDGSRTAEPADAERLKTFLDEFMLGEVWYNEGEAGLVSRPA
jgi:predicted ATPase